jgi:two-component sensor histidine kinase
MTPAVRPAVVGYPLAVSSDGSDRVSQRWQLTPDPGSARVARRLIHSVCDDWAVHDQTCHDALVVVTELVTNVVEHAGTECQLTVSIGDEGLRIEVRDFDQSRPPRLRPSSIWPARGHGLRVVALLSSQWGVTELDDGKSLWAVLPITTPPQTRRAR